MGGKGHDPGQLYYPYGVTITEDDHLVVTDQVTHLSQVTGKFNKTIDNSLCVITDQRPLYQCSVIRGVKTGFNIY